MEVVLRFLGIVALGMVSVGCNEANIRGNLPGNRGPQPDIEVEPAALMFPELQQDETATATFTIRNVGQATLDVEAIEVVAGAAAFSVSVDQAFEVEIDEARTIEVVFTPTNQGPNFGRLEIISDDPDEARAPVDLQGFGAVPDLNIVPRNFVFGEAFVPCPEDLNVKLENVGSQDIIIDSIHYTSNDGDLSLRGLAALQQQLPITLAPGEDEFLKVDWIPGDAAEDEGILTVGSNDPIGEETAQQRGTGVFAGTRTETFTEPGVPPVDVLFAIDQSCSMRADNEDTLAAGLPSFFGRLRELSDWQLIQVTNSDGCANGGVYDAASPSVESSFEASAFGHPDHVFSEALLELSTIALEKMGSGECNEGFVRPGSLLHVIVASDEREQSGRSWQSLVADLRNYVSHPDLLRVSSIVDLNFSCGDYYYYDGPDGYLQASQDTNGALLDICDDDWGDFLPNLAENAIQGIRSYNLSNRAVGSSIEVTVDGVPTTDFSYSDDAQTVTVLAPPVSQGDEVQITYAIAATCGN